MVEPSKMARFSLPPPSAPLGAGFFSRNSLGSGQGGVVAFDALHRLGAEDQHAVLRLRPHHLLPAVGGGIELRPVHLLCEDGAGGVVYRQPRPPVGQPVRVGDFRTGRRTVPGEDDVIILRNGAEVGDLAIGRIERREVLQLQLLNGVLDPDIAEAFPCRDGCGARPQHRPHRAFERAGVGGGQDADQIVVGNAEQLLRQVDGIFQPRLRGSRPVRAAEGVGVQLVEGPARMLRGGTG